MNRAPAFQFYPKDWLDFRVQRMSFAAQAAYLKLLCFMWSDSPNQCSIIDNNDLLAQAMGTTVDQWLSFRKEIQREFDPILEEKNGRLVSARLRLEAVKQRKYREAQAEKGKKSAQQRFNRGSTTVQPEYQPEGNSSSSSSSSSSLNSYRERGKTSGGHAMNGHTASFDLFWSAYPRKEGKGKCRTWWKRQKPDAALVSAMLAKIEQAKHTKKWKDDGGKYIPMPSTWLHEERWEDEFAARPASSRPVEVVL